MTATWAGLARLAAPPDADLLARFVAARDEAAFAELVRRHGPAVLAVCRRLTRHAHDAEDAFQAVFLVLARKAGLVRPGEPVAGWLYGVAVRAARNAAMRAGRRRGREALVAAVPDVPDRTAEPFDPDAVAAVAEEVGKLPDHLRAAVVLCELEGRSRRRAAAELGVAEGTLSSRLAAARKHLARRLAARGFAPAALALAPVVVPRRLAAAALLATTDRVPPAVRTLARGALPMSNASRLSVVPALAALAAAAALAAPGMEAPAPRPLPLAPAPRPVEPLVKGPNQLFFCWGDNFYRCDPDGRNGRVVKHPACPKPHPDWFSISPDGTKVAYPLDHEARRARGFKLLVFAADGTGPAADLGDGLTPDHLWSGDGTELCVGLARPGAEPRAASEPRYALIQVATGRRTPLAIPPGHDVSDWSRDGGRFLTGQTVAAAGDAPETHRLWVTSRAGVPVREVVPPAGMEAGAGRFSPDGRRVLYAAVRRAAPAGREVMLVCDLATGATTPVADVPPGGRVYHACWSPDGRRLAYTWHADRVEPKPGEFDPWQKVEQCVIVCDPDGQNRAVVVTGRSTANDWSIGTIDWR